MNRRLQKGILAFLGMLILILDSKTALTGASGAIELCFKTVIPSLFPFFVLSILLTNSLSGSSTKLLRPIAKAFRIPSGASILPVCSILGGYPVGAQSIGRLYQEKVLSKQDAEILLAYCNNAGPAFIFGMVACLFPQRWVPWALWIIHILSAYFVSRWFQCGDNAEKALLVKEMTISDAVSASVKTMSQVCGWIILFRIIITFLSRWILWIFPTPLQILIAGFMELTNGCVELMAIEDIKIRFVICSAMLAFGGICVAMQTGSVTPGLKLTHYFLGKTLQTLICVSLSWAFIYQQWLILLLLVSLFLAAPNIMQKKSSFPKPVGV